MVELFASPAAWLWWFQPPHPRIPLWKGSDKGGAKGFYLLLGSGGEKNNYDSQRFFFKFYLSILLLWPPKRWTYTLLRSPDSHPSYPYSPPLLVPVFGWLLCVNSLTGSRLRSQCIFYSIFFSHQTCRLQRLDAALPHVSTPARLLSNIPSTAAANS